MDLDFRPATYWDVASLELRIGRIKGEQRRRRAAAMLKAGQLDELYDFLDEGRLLEPDLTEEDRVAWGSLHPSNLGGEYLPSVADDEVEIARVAIASVTGDVTSIRARKDGAEIVFAIVDEYDNEYEGDGRRSVEPLSMAELIDLIDSADLVDHDGAHGGLVFSLLGDWYAFDPDDLVRLHSAATVSSAFYPNLGTYYEDRISEWISSRLP